MPPCAEMRKQSVLTFLRPRPDFCPPEDATTLAALLPASVPSVALTVNASDHELDAIIETLNPAYLQLHGHETPQRVAEIKRRTKKPVIKAVAMSGPDDIKLAQAHESAADLLLFDAKPPKSLPDALPGGNAIPFDWSIIAGTSWTIPWLLAGGLSVDNVAKAVKETGATFVDVSSGVEIERGLKDPDLIIEFLHVVEQL